MVVNFRACGISRGVRELARTPTLIKKIKLVFYLNFSLQHSPAYLHTSNKI